eukprot:scaffold731_cov261-Pinguiococcus_pyrenoidosus.AAC.63
MAPAVIRHSAEARLAEGAREGLAWQVVRVAARSRQEHDRRPPAFPRSLCRCKLEHFSIRRFQQFSVAPRRPPRPRDPVHYEGD